jgi:hypothetical protein
MPGPGAPFKPGHSRQSQGRPRGSRHKLSEEVLADLMADFEENGADAIQRVRETDPTAYVRIIASLLPKQAEKVPNPFENLTDEELDALEAWLSERDAEQPAASIRHEDALRELE